MLTNKIIINKFYLYKTNLVKVKKIHKSTNVVIVRNLDTNEDTDIPIAGSEILLTRLYTIGELAKIIGKRSDTLRKYEKQGLLPKSGTSSNSNNYYNNWRFYTESDVYDVIAFFSGRTPGRPAGMNVSQNIINLKKKVNQL